MVKPAMVKPAVVELAVVKLAVVMHCFVLIELTCLFVDVDSLGVDPEGFWDL